MRTRQDFFASFCGAVVIAISVLASTTFSLAQDEGAAALAAGGNATLVQVVQQAINIVPPAQSQAFLFEYDPELGAVVGSRQDGATVFQDPRTIKEGKWALRGGASYFSLSGQVATSYKQRNFERYSAYGTELSASAGVFSFAGTYGITDTIELQIGVPVTIVDASQSLRLPVDQAFLDDGCTFSPSSKPCARATVPTLADAQALARNGEVTVREDNLPADIVLASVPTNDVQANSFNDGTSVGLGRVSFGSKFSLWSDSQFALAALPVLFLPSPSQAEFAGPESFALAASALASYAPAPWLRAILNLGYEWDLENTALTRFGWAAGATLPTEYASFDLGMSGSVYQNGVAWSPQVLPDADPDRSLVAVNKSAVRLDDTFAQVLVGFKVPVADAVALSGSVAVPVVNTEFQPSALGTVAVEGYF